MFKIKFYQDRNGKEPVKEYIDELAHHKDKDSRIKYQKIRDYINYLSERGNQAKEPFAKHLDGEIWELRPLRDRILYAAWDSGSFLLIHHFMKQTRKTPRREIEQAKRNLADYRERSKRHEND